MSFADSTNDTAAGEKERFCCSILVAAHAGTLRKITLSSPRHDGVAPRQTARLASVRGQAVLTFEEETDGRKVHHYHLPLSDGTGALVRIIDAYSHVNIATTLGQAEMLTSRNGKVTLRGLSALKPSDTGIRMSDLLPHNRTINHVFDGSASFMQYLGISDKNGRVYDKKQAKFRQINRFIEYVDDIYDRLPESGTLLVYDLCCGKSYLSFALYAYLHEKKNRDVDMLCVDLKEDVIAFCAEAAQELGYTGMRFQVSDIRALSHDTHPDLVVSLHACDIATDIVLNAASEMRATVILSTPCCHRYLSSKWKCESLGFVTRHPYLKMRLSETITDALRVLKLESEGYRVDAVELVDVADTPRNTLLRAVLQNNRNENAIEKAQQSYHETLSFLLGSNAETYLKDL